MESILLPNGLTRRTANCLTKAGIPIERSAIVAALLDGTLYPHRNPRNYGRTTHREVCRWAGIDPLSMTPFPDETRPDRNAVLVAYARAMCDAQILENRLRTIALKAKSDRGDAILKESFKSILKATMGRLSGSYLQRIIPHHSTVASFLEKIVESRNYLSHEFFINEKDRLSRLDELPQLISKLQNTGKDFEVALQLLDCLEKIGNEGSGAFPLT